MKRDMREGGVSVGALALLLSLLLDFVTAANVTNSSNTTMPPTTLPPVLPSITLQLPPTESVSASRSLVETLTGLITFTDTFTVGSATVTSSETLTLTTTITPPPTPSRTCSQSEEFTMTVTDPTHSFTIIESATETLVGTPTMTMSLSMSITLQSTASLAVTETVTLPYITFLGNNRIYESAIQTGEPVADRTIIIKINSETLDLGKAKQKNGYLFFYECVRFDIGHAPSVQPYLQNIFTVDSAFSNNQSQFMTIVFQRDPTFRMLSLHPENMSIHLEGVCLRGREAVKTAIIQIVPGSSSLPAPPLYIAREIIEHTELPMLVAAGVVAGMRSSISRAFAAHRALTVSSLIECPRIETTISWFDHPTRVDVDYGSRMVSWPYFGAVLMDLAIVSVIVVVHLFIVASMMIKHHSKSKGQRMTYSAACAAFPSRSEALYVLFAPTVKCATVVGYSAGPTDSGLLVYTGLAMLPWILWTLFSSWIVLLAPSCAYTRLNLRKGSAARTNEELESQLVDGDDVDEENLCVDLYRRFVCDDQEWVSKAAPSAQYARHYHSHSVTWTYFTDRFLCLFGDFLGKYFWWFLQEMMLTLTVSLAEGISVATGHCKEALWIVTILFGVHVINLLRFWPFNVPYYRFLIFFHSLIIFSACVVGAIGVSWDQSSVRDAAQALCLSAHFLLMLDLGFQFILLASTALYRNVKKGSTTLGEVELQPLPSKSGRGAQQRMAMPLPPAAFRDSAPYLPQQQMLPYSQSPGILKPPNPFAYQSPNVGAVPSTSPKRVSFGRGPPPQQPQQLPPESYLPMQEQQPPSFVQQPGSFSRSSYLPAPPAGNQRIIPFRSSSRGRGSKRRPAGYISSDEDEWEAESSDENLKNLL